MAKMKELSVCINELKAAAAALTSAAETLTTLFSSEDASPVTKEEVRAELASKMAAGYGAQVRALLGKYGAAQLSAVSPEDYAALLKDAKAVGQDG